MLAVVDQWFWFFLLLLITSEKLNMLGI